MTRVLHVISGLGTGGAEMFLATLAPRLAERGFEQTVVSLTGEGAAADRLRAAGISVVALDAKGLAKAPLAVRSIAHLIEEIRPGVVQGWMYHGDLFAALATKLAAQKPERLMWNIRCSDMRLDDYALQLRLVVRACAKLSGVPDVIIANSEAGAREHKAAGYVPRAMQVIANGVDVMKFAPDARARADVCRELGIADDRIVVLNVARVDPMKDHATMLAAAAAIRGADVVLVGRGTEALALPAGVRALGARSDIARVLAAGDIIVSSSAYGEGFSNAIAEGMAAGLVPVVTDVGDARAIVGDTGRIVPPGDPAALAAALQEVLDLEPAARAALGAAARRRVASMFSLKAAVDRFAELYRCGSASREMRGGDKSTATDSARGVRL